MTHMLLGLALFLCVGLAAGAIGLLRLVSLEERFGLRVARAQGADPRALADAASAPFHVRVLAGLGLALARAGILTVRTQAELRDTLRTAGIRRESAVALFAGTKCATLLACPLIALPVLRLAGASAAWTLTGTATAAAIGLLAPDFAVRIRRSRYIKRLDKGLADALDLLVICADAGLSLEAGLLRVATEIHKGNTAVAEELTVTAGEMRISADSREALTNLGKRTGLEGLKRLAVTLIQTIQYGTPLTQALRTLSVELRQEQINRFEARAARLPVLLTVPMILFILPCVFIVVGGPAVLRVIAMFAHH